MTEQNSQQVDQIEEMLGTIKPEAEADVEVEIEAEPEEEPVDEGGNEEEITEPRTEEEEGANEKEEEGAEEEEEDETVALRETVANLTRTVREVKAKLDKQEVEEAPKFEMEATSFVATDDEYNTAMQSKEGLNALLHKAVSHGANKTIEHINLGLPKLVQDEAMRVVDNAVTIKLFWRDNADLRRLGDASKSAQEKVSAVYTQLQERFPTKSVDQLMSMLADATRKAYGVKTKGKKGNKIPPFAKTGGKAGRNKSKKKTNTIGDQIQAMGKL